MSAAIPRARPAAMRLVVCESPLKGSPPENCPAFLRPLAERVLRERNRHYAMACVREELERGRAPFASHVFFDQPGLLDDANPRHRKLGMDTGQAWSRKGDLRAFFGNRGLSSGMRLGSTMAREQGQEQTSALLKGYRPLALWRCVIAVVLRWMLGVTYG